MLGPAMTTPHAYPPAPLRMATLAPGERHVHSFRIVAWRYRGLGREPERAEYVGHFTNRRFLLEPLAGSEFLELDWNDVIEFERAEGSPAQEQLLGVEDHMIHCTEKTQTLSSLTEVFLFTAEPLEGSPPAQRVAHADAFIAIAEDLIVDAFPA